MIDLVTRLVALGLTTVPPAPVWDFIGITTSGLRLFVDRASVREAGGIVDATVRLGSPTPIVGAIVEVTEHDRLDCAGRRWRMLDFDAFDAAGAIVTHGEPGGAMLPVQPGSMGDTIRDAVCTDGLKTRGK